MMRHIWMQIFVEKILYNAYILNYRQVARKENDNKAGIIHFCADLET